MNFRLKALSSAVQIRALMSNSSIVKVADKRQGSPFVVQDFKTSTLPLLCLLLKDIHSTMFYSLPTLVVAALCFSCMAPGTRAFAPRPQKSRATAFHPSLLPKSSHTSQLAMSDFSQETSEAANKRIQSLVDEHPVLLFMKGSKLFPQCGFSNTAVQILMSYNIDFHTVDVLADESIRSGVKDFSQWPTIPQLYVAGEFVGGSDIMIEMYQDGTLAEMIEVAKAEM